MMVPTLGIPTFLVSLHIIVFFLFEHSEMEIVLQVRAEDIFILKNFPQKTRQIFSPNRDWNVSSDTGFLNCLLM